MLHTGVTAPNASTMPPSVFSAARPPEVCTLIHGVRSRFHQSRFGVGDRFAHVGDTALVGHQRFGELSASVEDVLHVHRNTPMAMPRMPNLLRRARFVPSGSSEI